MRYEASEKLEIIRLVEQSTLPVRQILEKTGVPRSTFHRWYDLYRTGGPEALADRPSRPNRTWNRIADDIRAQIVDLALEAPDLSPREIAVRFTDERGYFVSEASVYRLLKAHDLITSPRRYHESLNNLTPADVWLGRGQTILLERERIKRDTIQKRRLLHQQRAA